MLKNIATYMHAIAAGAFFVSTIMAVVSGSPIIIPILSFTCAVLNLHIVILARKMYKNSN